ncbi:hypothetical protein HS088_TW07G00935 [Tripterygium wilfordii]|uniref:Uncharacterized protein n=1 Tax=Tripterygium wilfordii TaxID=458696 RepID=A0A7J7DG81_TRIWF|nr:hypothetical protein HS088_TW07G00935 [Tripterygium wilfordii]
MALKMNEIRAAEAALFFLERLATVEIILHSNTPLLLAINLLLLAATTILYAVPYSARQHLGRPYSYEPDDDKIRYFCSERLGLLFVVLWMLGRCSYGLILGRAVLIYTNLKYLLDYVECIIAEDEDDDSDETQRKVEDSQGEQKEAEDYQVVEDNVSSNDEETQKREHSAEFPQELRVECDNLKKEKDLRDQALKRAQELYDNLKHRAQEHFQVWKTYCNKLKTDIETAKTSSEHSKKVALQFIKYMIKRYSNFQAQLEEMKAQVQDFEESRRNWNECKEHLTAELDAAMQSLDSYRDVIRDFQEAYDEKIKEKNSLVADREAANARLEMFIAKSQPSIWPIWH